MKYNVEELSNVNYFFLYFSFKIVYQIGRRMHYN